jgi:uncharacterized protein (TIRG00374 family)
VTASRSARPLLLAAGLVVTVVALYFALRGVDLDEAADALAASNLWWLVPSLAVFAVGMGVRALRWWMLFDAEQRPPLREVTRAMFIGLFFNNVLPARAGEAARVISLHARTKTPRAETIATVVAERLFDVLGLLVVLFAAYPWLPEISWLRAAAIFGLVVVLAVAVLVFALIRYDVRAIHLLLSPLRRIRREGFAARVEAAAISATRGFVGMRDPRVAFQALGLTIVSWVVLGTSYWILMQGFSLGLPIAAGLLVTVTINMGLVLPATPGSIGVFEAATIVATNAFDVPQEEGLPYALVLHLLNLVPFLVIGALLLGPSALRRRRRAGDE